MTMEIASMILGAVGVTLFGLLCVIDTGGGYTRDQLRRVRRRLGI